MYYTDDVRGVVVGGERYEALYKFFTVAPPGVEQYLGKDIFGTDAEAEAYARQTWPEAYARGIEMRVYNCEFCLGEGRIPAYGTGDQAGGYADTCQECGGTGRT